MSVQLTLVLAITIFHELMHHLTKIRFGRKHTPPGVGENFVAGEAGLELENKLFGGVIGVIWRTQDVAEPEKILHLVLENHKVNKRLSEYNSITSSDVTIYTFFINNSN